MVVHTPAWFALRPPRGKMYLLLALLVMTALVGCGRRRSSLRPVYVTPAPAVVAPAQAPCAGPDCPTTVAPGPVEPPPAGPTLSEPAAPPADSSVAPAGTSPPRVPSAAPGPVEPPLEFPSQPPGTGQVTPSARTQRTRTTSLDNGSRGPVARLRFALKERLRPFVNDPDDLFTPPKADRPWRYVVMHHSAHASGSYAEIDREHRKVLGYDGCGYHFVIGNGTESPDGKIEVAQRWSNQKQGAHCRDGKTADVNEYGIGICLVGDLDHNPPSPKQIEAARALVAYLAARYNIPPDRIGSHADVAASPTACPGKFFPASAILAARNSTAQK